MVATAILSAIWSWIVGVFMVFWPWIIAGASAVLAFLWSPTIRKYTIGLVVVAALGLAIFIWGYSSNHSVTTLPCTEYSKHLTPGAAADKVIKVFKKNGLCT